MWKSIYTLLLGFLPLILSAQLVEAPLQSNPALYNSSIQNEALQASMTNCPNLNGNYNYLLKNDYIATA